MLKIIAQEVGVKKAGRRIAGSGKLALGKSDKEPLSSPNRDIPAAFNERSELREALLDIWNVDILKAMKVCEERHVTVEGPESSCISFDRMNELWSGSCL